MKKSTENMAKIMAFFKKNSLAGGQDNFMSPVHWQKTGVFLRSLSQGILPSLLQRAQRATPNQRAISAVNGILLLLITYHLAKLTWLVLPTPPQEDAPPIAVTLDIPANRSTPGNPIITPQDMANWHLLGEVNTALPIEVDDAPETSLALTLSGVVASRDKKTARAIIADSTGVENFYALESQLPGGAVLKEIHADRVILSRGGAHETLLLPKDELDEGSGQIGEPLLPVATPDEAMMDEYRDALQNHPETLADRIQPMPVHKEGKFVGYRFLSPRDPTLLTRLGMQPGDIVTAVNGTQLDNPLKGMQVLRGISAEDEIRVDTLRNGAARSFILRMN